MISYEDWLEEPIPINKAYWISRAEYFKTYFPKDFDVRHAYEELLKCPTFNGHAYIQQTTTITNDQKEEKGTL